MSDQFKVLLVDDDPAMVRLLKIVIDREFGDQIVLTEFTDPTQAISWIESDAPDIVLTDLEMPVIGGIEILQSAKKRNVCVQVIILTGHSTTGDLFTALESGANDYLLKPADQSDLIRLLTQAIERITRWRAALCGTMKETYQRQH